MPVAFQASGGPPAGHSLSKPFSVEMSSMFGPRQRGQSPSAASPARGSSPANADRPATAAKPRRWRRVRADGNRSELMGAPGRKGFEEQRKLRHNQLLRYGPNVD